MRLHGPAQSRAISGRTHPVWRDESLCHVRLTGSGFIRLVGSHPIPTTIQWVPRSGMEGTRPSGRIGLWHQGRGVTERRSTVAARQTLTQVSGSGSISAKPPMCRREGTAKASIPSSAAVVSVRSRASHATA